jgi:predicted amidohydrolase
MRTLSVMGAEIIAHPSNLVLPYCPDAMPTRCLENGVFAVTANRTGVENRKKNEALIFIGQSEIVSPKGEILARASKDEETMMVAEIDSTSARNKSLNPYNDILKDRRTVHYR